MSLKYRDVTGKETPIAGLNGLSGELVPSVSYYQTGNIPNVNNFDAGASQTITVALATEMPDADYVVVFNTLVTAILAAQTKSSFTVLLRNDSGAFVGGTGAGGKYMYKAFKLMTDESRAIDEQAIATNTADIATINAKIPSTASTTNQLATANDVYVYSATATIGGSGATSFDLELPVSNARYGGLCVITVVGPAGAPKVWTGAMYLKQYTGTGTKDVSIAETSNIGLTVAVKTTGTSDNPVLTLTSTSSMYGSVQLRIYGGDINA